MEDDDIAEDEEDIAEEEKINIATKEVISKWRKRARIVHPDKVNEEENRKQIRK